VQKAACLLLTFGLLGAAPVAAAPPRVSAQKPAAESDLDQLFGALAHTRGAEDAKPIEEQILAHFLASGSPSVDLLMNRAAAALAGGDKLDAQRLLDAITGVAPNFAEGWHQRGKMLAEAGDTEGALVSLNKAVTLNPREFEAYAELGEVLLDEGDKKDALKILRKAIALDPHIDNLDKEVQALSREVEGEKI
jgi:tetratricopeptide (TPR) repeat protein